MFKNKNILVGLLVFVSVLVATLTPLAPASAASPPFGCPGGPTGPGAPTSCPYTQEQVNEMCAEPSQIPDGDSVFCLTTDNQTVEVNRNSEPVNPRTAEGTLDADCKVEGELNKTNCGIVAYIVNFTRLLTAVVGIVVVIMIAVGGIQYTTARDDPQQVSAAKTRIRNAILALVFYLFSFAFLQWLVPGGIF